MKKRILLTTSLLLLTSLIIVSGCQTTGGNSNQRWLCTLQTRIYTDDMNDELYTIKWSNRDDTITLTAGQTYILDVFVNDDNFNSQYKLKESHLTKEYDTSLIQLDYYDEKIIENHILYSFVGLDEDTETTMYIEMHITNEYGVSLIWNNFCFI